jgi:ABC toxin N-terminal region
VPRYTITDRVHADGTWSADSIPELCAGLRAHQSRAHRGGTVRPEVIAAIEELCAALTHGTCVGHPDLDAVDTATIRADRWQWMRRYRLWDAKRKTFLYPEDWLEPETRDATRTPSLEDPKDEVAKPPSTGGRDRVPNPTPPAGR